MITAKYLIYIEKIKSDEKLDNLKNKAALGMRIFCIVKDAYEFV